MPLSRRRATRPEDVDTSEESASLLDDPMPKQQQVPRRLTAYGVKKSRPRWILHLQAQFWRVLMGIGMFLHRLAPPHPPKPAFIKTIPSTLSAMPGNINLHFYVPLGYETQRKLWKEMPEEPGEAEAAGGKGHQRRRSVIGQMGESLRRRGSVSRKSRGYPVVINFHGGGFTLGTPADDARWCGTVVDECHAVVVAVDYRLAPEHPFPTAVEDGADAVIWVHQHADELGIDSSKIALSGFSSGGNMAITVPLRLWDEITGFARDNDDAGPQARDAPAPSATSAEASASTSSLFNDSAAQASTSAPTPTTSTKTGAQVSTNTLRIISDISIRAIVPWYPSLDYTRTREQRRATTLRKDQELPAIFTDLFDESYLHPPDINLDSPYLSPGVAPTGLLKNGLPQEIIMHTCEWDMLLDEGQAFRDRLTSPELGKSVSYKMVEGVPHGWDKAPNPLKPTPGVREHYLRACKELRRVFGQPGTAEHKTQDGPSAAPRGSVPLVK